MLPNPMHICYVLLNRKCGEGFSCKNVVDGFIGVLGDYSTPWRAFVTNMSFFTMRGWSNIFWAIVYTRGQISGTVIALILMGLGGLLVLNTVVAMVVRFMKTGSKVLERRHWLRLYPGNLSSVTELDLVMWAKRNNQLLLDMEEESGSHIRSFRSLVIAFVSMISSSDSEDMMNEGDSNNDGSDINETKDNGVNDAHAQFLDILEESKRQKALGPKRSKIRFLSPNCNIFKFLRHAAQDRFSSWNLIIFSMILVDLLLFACLSRFTDSKVLQMVLVGNVVLSVLFGVELLVMILSFGPIHYFNSFFNIYEAMLILLALGSLPNGICPYANIFRVIRIFRDQSRYISERRYARNSIWIDLNNWIIMINEAVESDRKSVV